MELKKVHPVRKQDDEALNFSTEIEAAIFFFWGGRWSFDLGKKSLFFEFGCWIFDTNQELRRCQETKQKSVMHILRLFVFQSLKEIFHIRFYHWLYNLLYRMMLDAQFKRLTLEEDEEVRLQWN
jgi:hypothetical protein